MTVIISLPVSVPQTGVTPQAVAFPQTPQTMVDKRCGGETGRISGRKRKVIWEEEEEGSKRGNERMYKSKKAGWTG